MIALLVGLASKNWRIAVAAGFGFAFCWPVASCQGKREAQAAYALKVQAAAEQVKAAASKAELAAALADMARASKTKEEAQELREIISNAKDDGAVGPAVSGVLERLRERNRR